MLTLEHLPRGVRHGCRSPGEKRYDRLSSRSAKAIAWLDDRPYPGRQLIGCRSNFISNDAALAIGHQSRKDQFAAIDRSSPKYSVAQMLGRETSQSPVAELCAVGKECHRLIGANRAHRADTMCNRAPAGHCELLLLKRTAFLESPSAAIFKIPDRSKRSNEARLVATLNPGQVPAGSARSRAPQHRRTRASLQ